MRLWKKGLSIMAGAGLLASVFAGSALAAEEREKISSIDLTIDSSIEAGSDNCDVSVAAGSSNYEVTDVEVTNDDGDWSSGDEPQVEITLEAGDDYYFGSMSKSKVDLKGDDATYMSSSRKNSSSTLIVKIKLEELVGDLEIDDVRWDADDSPLATWEEADGAKTYQVRLYRGSSSVGSAVTTSTEYYDFASKITRDGEYYFKVRAVDKNNSKGDWYESDYIYVDEEMLEDIQAGNYSSGSSNSGSSVSTSGTPGSSSTTGIWQRDNVGWWYRYPNGSYPTNGWLMIDNVWYCFDSVGYMRTGWIQAGNYWYYCDTSSGAMLTNTWTPDNYYVDANGIWIPSMTR